jgi:hypothetical protein
VKEEMLSVFGSLFDFQPKRCVCVVRLDIAAEREGRGKERPKERKKKDEKQVG